MRGKGRAGVHFASSGLGGGALYATKKLVS